MSSGSQFTDKAAVQTIKRTTSLSWKSHVVFPKTRLLHHDKKANYSMLQGPYKAVAVFKKAFRLNLGVHINPVAIKNEHLTDFPTKHQMALVARSQNYLLHTAWRFYDAGNLVHAPKFLNLTIINFGIARGLFSHNYTEYPQNHIEGPKCNLYACTMYTTVYVGGRNFYKHLLCSQWFRSYRVYI